MATADQQGGGGPAAPASMRIRLKYADEETFIQKFGMHVTRNGIFLATKGVKPPGTVVRFELLLADGKRLLRGEGVVAWTREHDPERPNLVAGMGLRYSKLDADSRKLVERIARFKKQHGNGDDGGVPAAPMMIPDSGPVALSGPVTMPPSLPPAETSPPRRLAVGSDPEGSSPARAEPKSPAELAELNDLASLDANLASLLEGGAAMERLLLRARELARGAGGDGLADLEKLLEPSVDAAQATIEQATMALAIMLGAEAPSLRRRVLPDASIAGGAPLAADAASAAASAAAMGAALRPSRDRSQPEPLPATPVEARRPRRTVPPPPPPPRSGRTRPPPMAELEPPPPPPAPGEIEVSDDDTRESTAQSLAEMDAALAALNAPGTDADDPAGEFAGDDSTRASAPPAAFFAEQLATTVGAFESDPAPPAPPFAETTDFPDPLKRSAASLDADELAGSALAGLGDGVTPLPPPPGLSAASMLDIAEPDEDVETGVVSPQAEPLMPSPAPPRASEPVMLRAHEPVPAPGSTAEADDDLAAALDAALDLNVEPDEELDLEALAAAAVPPPPLAPEPLATLEPTGEAGDDGQSGDGGEKKRGFFSKLFKK